MKFAIKDYIDKISVTSGCCINTTDGADGKWKGYKFSIREGLDEYEAIEDWQEDSGETTEYVYRDFKQGSADCIRGEFSLWDGGYAGDELTLLMIKNYNYLIIDEVQKKDKNNRTFIEKVAIYVDKNGDDHHRNTTK